MSELIKIGMAPGLYTGILSSVSEQLLDIYISCVEIAVPDSEPYLGRYIQMENTGSQTCFPQCSKGRLCWLLSSYFHIFSKCACRGEAVQCESTRCCEVKAEKRKEVRMRVGSFCLRAQVEQLLSQEDNAHRQAGDGNMDVCKWASTLPLSCK